MGGHHKKNLRAEKAKVKLKGAKLPKGLNVTKTDFKVRKIEIRGQVRESAILTSNGQRQLILKETLSRLKHHNLKFRTEAMRNVRDAVKLGQAEQLIGHLNELFQGVAGGVLDIERDVRKESCKTLDVLLEALPSEAVVPFFHIIAAYLRCAMTHVQPTIQEDSLQLLDVLLQRLPSRLLAERSASTIIGHFIDMISRSRHDTQHTNRLLTVRMGQGQGQQTTIKWRTKVLLRLQQILGTLLQQEKQEKKPTTRVEYYNVKEPQYYNVLTPFQMDQRGLHALLGAAKGKAQDQQLRGYVEQLLPLLQDNWLEVRPQQQQQGQGHLLLNQDAAESLHVILDIMSQLWQLVQQYESSQQELNQDLSNWLRQQFATTFLKNFLQESSFPYQRIPLQITVGKKRKKGSNCSSSSDELCLPQNLTLVQLVCHFCPHPNEDQGEDYRSLLIYINECLSQVRSMSPEDQLRLVAALRALLLDNGLALLELQAHQMGFVMHNCIQEYVEQHYTTREGVATKILNLLCQIVQRRKLYDSYGGDAQFDKFLEYLPQLLLKPSVADATLTAMSTLCREQNRIFMAALEEIAIEVVGNLEQLQVTGEANNDEHKRFENQKRILNLFYYANRNNRTLKHVNGTSSDPNKMETALKHLQQHGSERVANYLKCVLSYD